MARGRNDGEKKRKYLGIIRGILTAVIFSIFAVLIYAVVIKSFSMGDKTIPYFNQVIKILGIIIAAYYGVKSERKFFHGAIGGVLYILITYLLFSGISGAFGSFAILLSDLVMGAVIGLIFAFVALRFSQMNTAKE